MKLSIAAFLYLAGGAAAFVQQPMQSASAQTILAMASEPSIGDRRAFVTKVSMPCVIVLLTSGRS